MNFKSLGIEILNFQLWTEPYHENLVPVAYESRKGSGKPVTVQMHRLTRAFTTYNHKAGM